MNPRGCADREQCLYFTAEAFNLGYLNSLKMGMPATEEKLQEEIQCAGIFLKAKKKKNYRIGTIHNSNR